jgi:molybdenum cofactor guanylyltransferase
VDLPLMPASLVAYLVEHAELTGAVATVPSVNGFAQTFPSVVARAALPVLQDELRTGGGGCFAAFRVAAARLGLGFSIVPVELVAQTGRVAHPNGLPSAFWFLNVNSPGELARAEILAARTDRVS